MAATLYQRGGVMKRDLYAEVSARIVAELERGAAPWIKPWSATAGANTPCNAAKLSQWHNRSPTYSGKPSRRAASAYLSAFARAIPYSKILPTRKPGSSSSLCPAIGLASSEYLLSENPKRGRQAASPARANWCFPKRPTSSPTACAAHELRSPASATAPATGPTASSVRAAALLTSCPF